MFRSLTRLCTPWCLVATLAGGILTPPGYGDETLIDQTAQVGTSADANVSVELSAGDTVEISASVVQPSSLPPDGRVRVSWTLTGADDRKSEATSDADELKLYTSPTPNWTKLLHALDADVYVVYRAPENGVYSLTVAVEAEDVDLFDGKRWREKGVAPKSRRIPRAVAWAEGTRVDVATRVSKLDLSGSEESRFYVEVEPNDTPQQAQPISLPPVSDGQSQVEALHVQGTADDIEYFDNGYVGRSGDDWFRLEFPGPEKRMLTVCLSIADQQVAAQIRCYRVDPEKKQLVEYSDGKNLNEKAHQQTETHRTAINRWVEPGGVYFLRVEANAPGYELELRLVAPPPYDDPRAAIRHGLYDHIGQVDAWLTNRPRGASVERRIRDSGNLLGTNCMSCHTQSGVWGPAIPFALGYRPENVQLWRHLINTCYQSMRPTNELIDAANNTSLRPLDLGDGPAGTRVTGHAVVALERFSPPRKLQSKQAIRAANFVLQSGDPGGINAAGPGANVGQGVVFNYAGEIVFEAWKKTGEPRYFRALEDKARKILAVDPKFSDDLGHRVEFLSRYFPENYVEALKTVLKKEKKQPAPTEKGASEQDIDKAHKLANRIKKQIAADIERLRAIQLEDGGWNFDPGRLANDGTNWNRKNDKADPAPSALALIAFQAAGFGPNDPTVAKGIQALLKMQHPTGLWKVASTTGFVGTSYALHALARFYPTEPTRYTKKQFAPREGESLIQTLRRVRDLSVTADPALVPLMVKAAHHKNTLVRYWALIALGATHTEEGVGPLVRALGDHAKPVREAAHWALRQTLIDDRGWGELFEAISNGDDRTRETATRTLVMKVDGVLPQISAQWNQLVEALDHAMNEDDNPAVRAWGTKAAWQWWIWNPPVRNGINDAWVKLLKRHEENAIVENTIRYQSHALFIANGHVANGSKTHQYKELATLFERIVDEMDAAAKSDPELSRHLTQRIVDVAATFYNQTGGDGGPGQMGYVTENSTELFANAVMANFDYVESLPKGDDYERNLRLTLEGAAHIPFKSLQERLIKYSLEGPEKFRALASSSISDPKLVQLIAVAEKLEPMHAELVRGANEPARRAQLSEPILKMFRRVRWLIPETKEQRSNILKFFVPEISAYRNLEEIKRIDDDSTRASAEHTENVQWYLASSLGTAVAENPDLHFDAMAEALPQQFDHAAQAQTWIRSVPWILGFKLELPEIRVDESALPPLDPYEELRTRALRLFLTQLTPQAEPRNRQVAVGLTNQTALRRNPEILSALERLVKFEKDKKLIETAEKVLSTGRGKFLDDLANAVKTEPHQKYSLDGQGNIQLPQEFIEDFTYFRDYVTPEMSRVLRTDRRSCMACHGVPDRTPMNLHHPDDVGFLPVDKLLANYRTLQQRIDYTKVDRSKLLRKPLNVQTGKEDGHQGGRRYSPMDPGYQLLRRWSINQLSHQEKLGRPKPKFKVRRF